MSNCINGSNGRIDYSNCANLKIVKTKLVEIRREKFKVDLILFKFICMYYGCTKSNLQDKIKVLHLKMNPYSTELLGYKNGVGKGTPPSTKGIDARSKGHRQEKSNICHCQPNKRKINK